MDLILCQVLEPIFLVIRWAFFTSVDFGFLSHCRRGRLGEVVKVFAWRVFMGTGDLWEMDDSGMEAPVQSATCGMTGLGGSTNRGICNSPY